jgi:uncharacterized protein (TIGR03435 family)
LIKLRFLGLCFLFCAVCPALYSQSKSTEAPLAFDVASVKPNTSSSNSMSIDDDVGGGLTATNVSVRLLIRFAYNLRDYQILNAPGWADTERFDVFAKLAPEAAASEPAPHSAAANERLRRRSQNLLAERFGLVIHSETREMPVYALVIAKGGPKLKESTSETAGCSMGDRHIQCRKMTMQQFAEVVLSNHLGHKVVDKTALTGVYDIAFDYVQESVSKPGVEHGASEPADLNGATFLTAMQEQLGVRIETTKGTDNFYVVEQVKRPTAN